MTDKATFDKIFCYASPINRNKFYDPLVEAMEKKDIITPLRIAAFCASIIHESGSFRYVREIASGKAYEGRKNLGNIYPGDGVKFKGRGLIQITGRSNYALCGKALAVDLLEHPILLESTLFATQSAVWFWNLHGLNGYADKDDFRRITKIINGGYNGWEDRFSNYNRIKKLLL